MSNKLFVNSTVLFFAILFFSTTISAQTDTNKNFNISAAGHYGFLIGHHGSMRYLMEEHVKGFEVSVTRPTHGKKQWQRAYCYPETGLSFICLDLGNRRALGYGISIFPFINFPLATGSRISLYFRVGGSLGYVTKKFDRLTNHKNDVIGSHINGFANFYLNTSIKLSDQIEIKSGIGISHFSNAAVTVPNLGVNIPTVSAGATYRFNTKNIQLIADSCAKVPNKTGFVFYYLNGICELEPVNGPKYLAFSIGGNIERTVNIKNRYVAGFDVFYNMANIDKLKQKNITIKPAQNIQAGIKIGYALVIGRLSLPIEAGGYLYTKLISNGYVYNRVGVKYYLSDHLIINLSLKTHFAKADYLEGGIGYKL